MGHCVMAIHSESSFNEAHAIRMLSDLLESNNTNLKCKGIRINGRSECLFK